MRANSISQKLAARVYEIASRLLPEGKRAGNYWQAGDVHGAAGTSLYLHLEGDGRGQWRDAATGEGGDLLDLIAAQRGVSIGEAMPIAEEILGESPQNPSQKPVEAHKASKPRVDTKKSAISLWARSRYIMTSYGLQGQAYLAKRGIEIKDGIADLRFHKGAWLKADDGNRLILPAIIAAVRNGQGDIIAVHRTFLDPEKPIKAQIAEPKRALGPLTGGGCWLRSEGDVLIVAEGIETALSVGMAFGGAALAAGISAHHLTAMEIPPSFTRIMIAADNDDAGRLAAENLTLRLKENGVGEVKTVHPRLKDWNDDLQADGLSQMKERINKQMKS